MQGYGRTLCILGAMFFGALLHRVFTPIGFLMPYLIFLLLFIPFCGMNPHKLRFGWLHFWLLLFQVTVCIATYVVVRRFDEIVAQGAMVCVLAPTATAAIVIGAMLGASVEVMISYTVLVNCMVAVVAPLMFTIIGAGETVHFLPLLWRILQRVMPLLLLPFFGALALRLWIPKAADGIARLGKYSFYIWLFSLLLTMSTTTTFIIKQGMDYFWHDVEMAVVALVICVAQYMIGWRIGHKLGYQVEGRQLLGQKNTILTIWMAQHFLNPLCSIAPAAYVLWQNIVNGIELGRTGQKQKA